MDDEWNNRAVSRGRGEGRRTNKERGLLNNVCSRSRTRVREGLGGRKTQVGEAQRVKVCWRSKHDDGDRIRFGGGPFGRHLKLDSVRFKE